MKICDICKKEVEVYETNDFMKDLRVNDICKPCAKIIDEKMNDFLTKQVNEKNEYRRQIVNELLNKEYE